MASSARMTQPERKRSGLDAFLVVTSCRVWTQFLALDRTSFVQRTPQGDAFSEAAGNCFTFDEFLADDAFELGSNLYTRIAHYNLSASISIIGPQNPAIYFRATTGGTGATMELEKQHIRKQNTVKRFGKSTWALFCTHPGKPGLAGEETAKYDFEGGATPIRVRSVDGIVAIVSVCGLGS